MFFATPTFSNQTSYPQIFATIQYPQVIYMTGSKPESINYQHSTPKSRNKISDWSLEEDNRLKEAIEKYGTSDWSSVAKHVGNGRTKYQCNQRWNRCVNPSISKQKWSPHEEENLINLVDMYGTKSWKKIAYILGNRSDIQCRYHYKTIATGEFLENTESRRKRTKNISRKKCKEALTPLPSIADFLN